MIRADAGFRPQRLAVVLAGGGARGAYEAGVLSVLLPELERAGIRPAFYVGTSAGAINACLFAAHAHLPGEQQAAAVLDIWRGIEIGDVFTPVLRSAVGATARRAGQVLGVPGARLLSLVDTAPLRATAEATVPWQRLRTNLGDGDPAALAVVATSARTGRAVVFVDEPGAAGPPAADDERPIDYVATAIGTEHLLASAAIPVLFPPIQVTAPAAATGWYSDGGVRLNAPLKPAIAMGADALLVVATHPATAPAAAPPLPDGEAPDVDDSVVALIDAALVDPMVEDVRTLGKVNRLVVGSTARTTGGRAYSQIPFLCVGPESRGTLAREAANAYDDRFGGLLGVVRGLAHPDLPLLSRFVTGDGDRRGDVLSYLFFERGFVDRAIAVGCDDAAKQLGSGPGIPWLIAL